MLERESDWRRFLGLIYKIEPSESLAQQMHVPLRVVNGYRDQINGKQIATMYVKRKHVVGFRYKRLNRWISTPEIVKAKKDHDEGWAEVCQGLGKIRGEDAYILYAIPRKRRRMVKRGQELAYFSRILI